MTLLSYSIFLWWSSAFAQPETFLFLAFFVDKLVHSFFVVISYIKANNLTKIVADRILPDFFSLKTLQYGHRWIPLDPGNKNGTFWADSGPQGYWGHRGYAKVTLPFLFKTRTLWVFVDSPGPQQLRFIILSWLRTSWTLRPLRVCWGHSVFFVPNPYNLGI